MTAAVSYSACTCQVTCAARSHQSICCCLSRLCRRNLYAHSNTPKADRLLQSRLNNTLAHSAQRLEGLNDRHDVLTCRLGFSTLQCNQLT